MATVNQLLSSESKSGGIPIEFEIVSQPRLRKENDDENQLVAQPITHTSFIENSIEAGNLLRGNDPTNQENQLVSQPEETDNPNE